MQRTGRRERRAKRAGRGIVAGTIAGLVVLGVVGWLRAPRLLEVELPDQTEVGVAGIPILIRFDPQGHTAPSTFRALLNGADVTDQLEVAANGVHGRLHGLLDGDNRLEVAAFGRGWLGWWESRRVMALRYRRPLDADRG